MEQRSRSRVIAVLATFMVLAVGWNLVAKRRPARVAVRASGESLTPQPLPPPPTRSQAGTQVQSTEPSGPGYLDLLARAQIRRRIRASAPRAYLDYVVAQSGDSMLHRWDDRVGRPVRVYLTQDTVTNFQPAFLDAIRTAFQRWEQAGVPVRFALAADSSDAEVRFAWRLQFDIDRTGETDLEWDQDGHLRSGVVIIATQDPRGQPLAPDDVRVVALHEIGHLIGLDHSPDSTDLMFAKTVVRDLSERDIRTALLLYDLAPGSLR
jgi:hypothetical protein